MSKLQNIVKRAEEKGVFISIILHTEPNIDKSANKWAYPPIKEHNYQQVFELISKQLEEA